MGMFDTLLLTCPHCGKTTRHQSKADDCYMADYYLESAPLSIIADVAKNPLTCDQCNRPFMLAIEFKVNVVALGE